MSMKVKIHNVGHGQAIHILTPNQQNIVIDLGCSDEFSPLNHLRRSTRTIDLLVITHPHTDHIDEIAELKQFYIRQLNRPKWLTQDEIRSANRSSDSSVIDEYIQLSSRFLAPIQKSELVGSPENSGGISFQVFYSSNCEHTNINNHSAVVVLEYLGAKIVIPGDNESPSWKELLKNRSFVNHAKGCQLFVASHHGRESGYYGEIFNEDIGIGKPQLFIISDGKARETNVSSSYSNLAKGWPVHSRTKLNNEQRSCITTRRDGLIEVDIYNANQANYMIVTCD